jgi:hypothetical protein
LTQKKRFCIKSKESLMTTQATSNPGTTLQSPTFAFDNRGTTYNAWCHVNYTDPNSGQSVTWDSGQFGQETRSASIPAGATNITLEGGAIGGGFLFNPVLSCNPLPASTTTITFSGSQATPTYLLKPLTFVFDNQGTTYNAWCHVNYTDPNSGQSVTWDSGQFGQETRSASIPAGATNITLEGGAIGGGFLFNPVLSCNPLPASTTTITFSGSQATPTYTASPVLKPLTFVFDNQGTTYNAWCHVNYTNPYSGQAVIWDSGQFSQETRSTSVPAGATNITLEGGAIDGGFLFNPVLSCNPLPASTTTITFSGSQATPTYSGI